MLPMRCQMAGAWYYPFATFVIFALECLNYSLISKAIYVRNEMIAVMRLLSTWRGLPRFLVHADALCMALPCTSRPLRLILRSSVATYVFRLSSFCFFGYWKHKAAAPCSLGFLAKRPFYTCFGALQMAPAEVRETSTDGDTSSLVVGFVAVSSKEEAKGVSTAVCRQETNKITECIMICMHEQDVVFNKPHQ